jgi:hypothetical protein
MTTSSNYDFKEFKEDYELKEKEASIFKEFLIKQITDDIDF